MQEVSETPEKEPVEKRIVSPVIANIIAMAVTIVWCISFIADIGLKDYAPPTGIHFAFTTVLGGIYGYQFIMNRDQK